MSRSVGTAQAYERLIRHLESITDLSDAERDGIRTLPLQVETIPAHSDIVRQGEKPTRCCLLLDGLLVRHKVIAQGDRQIFSFHFPGDIPDLQSLHINEMDHNLGSVVQSRVAFIPHPAMSKLMRDQPGVASALWRDTLIEASIFREWIVNVGVRPADKRIAHLVCELYARTRAVGLAKDDGFDLPLTQTEIAEATGISAVHVNRTMQTLRRRNLIVSEGRFVRIPDLTALQTFAGFDVKYLHLRREF